MDAFGTRAVDVNLEQRPRQWQQVDLAGGELHRQRRLWLAVRQHLEVIRADRFQDQRQVGAQDAVFVEALDGVERVVDRLDFSDRVKRAAAGTLGVEAALEELDQAAGDGCVAHQGLLHIALAKGGAGLAQHLAVKPQHDNLPRRQAGSENEPVEPVILDRPVPYGEQRFLEAGARCRGERGGYRAGRDREFMHPDRLALDTIDAERLLGDDAQAEIFQDRQDVGQHHRLVRPVYPQTDPLAFLAQMQRSLHRGAAQHRLDPVEISNRLSRRGVLLISGRKDFQAAQPSAALDFAGNRGNGFLDPVGPGAARFGETPFEGRHIDRRHRAARRRHQELDARQHRLVQMGGGIRHGSGEGLFQDFGEVLPQPAVVPLARNVDEAGDEAFERIAVHEQRDALALLQIENTNRRVEQILFADLEQEVAREGVEDVQQRLAVMAVGSQAGAGNRALHLLPQQRDRARRAVIGERGKQPGEEAEPDDLAIRAETADTDRVHQRVAMDGGAAVGLGDEQQFALQQEILHVARQGGEIP